jgi:hypothetical protein
MALAQALRCPWSPPPKWSALPTVTAAASPPTSRSNMRRRSSRRRSDRRPPRPSRTDPGSCACRRCTGRRAGGYPQWQRKAVIAQAPPQQRPAFVLAKDVLREAFAPQPMNLQIRAQAASVAHAGSPVPCGVQLLPGRSRYRRARPWSAMLGRYDNWSATRRARCAEFGVTEALPLITGDTVAIETRTAIRDIGYLWATDPASKPHPDSPGCSPTTPSCQVLPPRVPGNAYLCH